MYQPKTQNPALAAVFIGIATMFIAASMLLAKALGGGQFGPPLHPLQVSFGRFAFAFLAISTGVAILRPRITRIHWKLHGIRTISGWAGVTLMFAAVAYIPLADATAITFLNPVFGMILAIPILGERVGPWRWRAAIIAFLGAVILIRPSPSGIEPAALLSLGAAVAMGLELTITKKLAGREGPLQILFFNNLLGCAIASCAAIWVWQMPNTLQWVMLGGLGCSMAVAQSFFVNAMARADASFVAPFSYATLIFATLYDIYFYSVIPDIITLIGAGMILGGALLLAWREGIAARKNVSAL